MRPESVRLRSYGAHHAGTAPGIKPEVLLPHLAAIAADVRAGIPAAEAIERRSLQLRRTLKEAAK